MSLPIIIAFIAVLFFGILAVFFSLKETKMKRLLKEAEKKSRYHLYKANILKEIQNNINYSLDLEKLIAIITDSLKNFLPYSTASSLVLKNDKLVFNTKVNEPVNTDFITKVKNNMCLSLLTLTNLSLPKSIEQKIEGLPLNTNKNSTPSSFFNIPLIVNEKIYGIISICSTRPHLYKEEEMTIIYKITALATNALSRLQEILIRENSKLTSLTASLEDGIFMVDLNNQITVINRTAKDLLNLQKANPTLKELLSNLPNSYNFLEKIEKAITLNQKIEEKDVQLASGQTYDITIIPILDTLAQFSEKSQNKAIGASFLIHNVTLEKSLSKMQEDFTHIIVHELRSPLTSIKASTEMLAAQNNLTEENKKSLINIINGQAVKMLDEVAAILDSAKLDTGVFSIQKSKGDLKKVIEDTIESFRMIARNKSVNLISHIDPFLPQIQFDSYNIRRVISNLLSNSLKFTPPSGTVTVRAWPESEKIYVSVSDTGSGIPKVKHHLLFSKFSQTRSKDGASGTGLGLYIVKGIIEAHGGTVSLESEPGKGTTISFSLPSDTIPQQPQPLPPNTDLTSSQKPLLPLI